MYGVSREKAQKLKGGGPVLGPGTGTSDSIKANVPAGSYIMPADSTAKLGLNSKQSQPSQPVEAPRLGMGVPVNLSNGEHQFTPEQVSAIGVQALDHVKDATHAPAAEPKGKEMFFVNGGPVEDPLLKRRFPGEPSAALTPATQAPGNPNRAAQMQAQFDQPVTGPRSAVTPAKQTSFDATNTPQAQRPAGVAGGDIAQIGMRIGGNLSKGLESSQNKMPLARFGFQPSAAQSVPGLSTQPSPLIPTAVGGFAGKVQGMAKDAANIPAALPPTASGPIIYPNQAQAQTQSVQQPQSNGYAGTGIGKDSAGGEIVAKVGADGVPEFSNDAAAQAGARGTFTPPQQAQAQLGTRAGQMAAPSGSRVLASGSNVPVGEALLASPGSARNMNNGIGTFSVMGQPGDAAKAIATFDRANAIRAGMQRPREMGDNGGQLNIVRDSSRAPTLAEFQQAKLDNSRAQTTELQGRGARDERRLGIDSRRLDAQDARNQTNDSINNQKTQQEIQAGQLSLDSAQRTEQLRQMLADPSVQGADRANAEAAYASLTTGEKDRYMQVAGGTNNLGGKDASMVFDKRTREMVSASGGSTASNANVDEMAKRRGISREQVLADMKAHGITLND
jgi:hypothetical protein